jgi:hypothetical protein
VADFDPNVTYRPIPSLPVEFYRAGDDGSVWSCQKKGRGAGMVGEWRQLNPRQAGGQYHKGKGYLGVRLGVNGVRRDYYVHLLVLEAFCGPCPSGMQARHLDGNCLNNRVDNLAWGTPVENCEDKQRHGTQPQGNNHYLAKLQEEDIPMIRERVARGESITVMARALHVHPETIRDVCGRRTWKHIS